MIFKIFRKVKKLVMVTVATSVIISSIISSPVYAYGSDFKAGVFVGWDQNIDTSIMSDPNYEGKIDLLAVDLENFNGKNDYTSIGAVSAPSIRALNKDVYVSIQMPNPAGGNMNSTMSDADFSVLANAKIENINESSSTLLKNYKAIVDRIGDVFWNYRNNNNIYFRPFHEMNGSWYWWGNKNYNDFKSLWINIHDYLVGTNNGCRGLTWLKFCYAPNSGSNANTYYPGDAYVDVVGMDAYSDDPVNDVYIKKAYAQLVGGTYNGITYSGINKPFGFAEIGPDVGGAYVDSRNRFIKAFDYKKWSDAIRNNYSKAEFVIVMSGAYDPRNNINGTALYNNTRILSDSNYSRNKDTSNDEAMLKKLSKKSLSERMSNVPAQAGSRKKVEAERNQSSKMMVANNEKTANESSEVSDNSNSKDVKNNEECNNKNSDKLNFNIEINFNNMNFFSKFNFSKIKFDLSTIFSIFTHFIAII